MAARVVLPDYEGSVGSMLKVLRSFEGRAEGDPRKIADVIVQLANSDEVPVRGRANGSWRHGASGLRHQPASLW
jgi:hypothetical protein